MARSTEELLDKVRKLLALATSPNVHEAAAAAARAQDLITGHQLQALLDAEEEAEAALSDGRDAPLEVARKIRKWKAVLASGLARANGCEAYTVKVGRREEHLCVAGRDEHRQAVETLWDWVVKRLEWLSATHGQDQPREWHESFRIGAADTVVARLSEAGQAAREALSEGRPTAALVRLDAALSARAQAVSRFTESELNLKKGRSVTVWLDALEAGRAAGHAVVLPSDGQRSTDDDPG